MGCRGGIATGVTIDRPGNWASGAGDLHGTVVVTQDHGGRGTAAGGVEEGIYNIIRRCLPVKDGLFI